MVKHTQTIRWQQPTSCLRVFDHFMGLAFKGLRLDFTNKFKFEHNFLDCLKSFCLCINEPETTDHKLSFKHLRIKCQQYKHLKKV